MVCMAAVSTCLEAQSRLHSAAFMETELTLIGVGEEMLEAVVSLSKEAQLHSATVESTPTKLAAEEPAAVSTSLQAQSPSHCATYMEIIYTLVAIRGGLIMVLVVVASLSFQAQSHSSDLKYTQTLPLGGTGPMSTSQEEPPPAPST